MGYAGKKKKLTLLQITGTEQIIHEALVMYTTEVRGESLIPSLGISAQITKELIKKYKADLAKPRKKTGPKPRVIQRDLLDLINEVKTEDLKMAERDDMESHFKNKGDEKGEEGTEVL